MSLANTGIGGQSPIVDSVGGVELIRNAKAQVIESIHSIAVAANVKGLWVFDIPSGTTIQDRSTLNHDTTLSANANTLSPSIIGLCPHLMLNGGLFTVSDHADFTFGNGATDSAFSLILLLNPLAAGMGVSQEWLTKYATSHTEYGFHFNASNVLELVLYDDSAGASIGRGYNSTLAGDAGSWHTYISTYSGSATAAGIKLYRDSVQVDDTSSGSGVYTAMEDKAAALGNFYDTNQGAGKAQFGVVGVVAGELTATQVKRIDTVLRGFAGINF